ncbi:hypothetical protein CCAX7_21790 [Capsulimonas corticalis]|uniref:Uncharacterized protein n=1 Tax=Capsulimonas corticalis TaxID=2219043 RepID=A0A402D246_9BACT|nr:hypothetical protein [Capsulimonas corticalis]BDI30128.1 hypothetical protein CCAX7_21790 [Capsulimonas corticalis]
MFRTNFKMALCAAAFALTAGTAVALSASALAQDARAGQSASRMQEFQARMQKLAAYLGVTDAQKTQIKPILKNAFLQVRAIRRDPSLTLDQQADQIDAIRTATRHQVLAILTPDQKAKLQQMIAARARQ